MRNSLFPFQERALQNLHQRIFDAHTMWREDNPQVISFSAPTGSGKTIIMTSLIEELLYGSIERMAEPDSIFVWLSDSPELNEQSRLKIENKSDKIMVRNLVTIDSNFDADLLGEGCIYFINTQKLGTDKLLTQKSDDRQYTIWETFTNTAKKKPKQLYIIIDEAHRGTILSLQDENKAQSIMQKFIKGSPEDGLSIMPLVIGVTATPQRFDNLIAGTSSTIQKTIVQPEEVIESGLLKDRLIIHYPENTTNADMTMFEGAVNNWSEKCRQWEIYCRKEKDRIIKPILVVQVEDGNERIYTSTDIGTCIDILERQIKRKFSSGEIVHTFINKGSINIGETIINKIEASRIEEDENIMVVFFKKNLSTGWDCPRAETMMSFRSACDYTYIAQLLGRMIRTPLSRKIRSNAELNNVGLYLPYFNEDTVKNVIDSLRDSEAATLTETGTEKELVTLVRNSKYIDIFEAMEKLITYRVSSIQKQQPLCLLMKLSRAITMDGVDLTMWRTEKESVINEIEKEIGRIKASGEFDKKASDITGVSMETMTFDYGQNMYIIDANTQILSVTDFDINRHFDQAGRILGSGLHKEYWIKHRKRNHIEVKTEIIVLVNDTSAIENLNKYASKKFAQIYEKNKRSIALLREAEKSSYEKMISSSIQPISIPWTLPESIDFSFTKESVQYDKHLYKPLVGIFKASLNSWESELITEEINNGAIAWLRNLDRKSWSLEIPYEAEGVTTSMYPDLIVIRDDKLGFIFDILEPHDSSRKDNYPKAIGLAKFAERHWDVYGRIQLIRKQKGIDGINHFYRLDMSKADIRNKVRRIASNIELDHLFEEYAKRE